MDPEGVRDVFYAECGASADYGIRSALRSLPFLARFKESFFHGVHLPLTLPLPKRLDVTLQQSVGLHAYDAIVLADIDPVVFDADDLLNLLAYVEGGGGLLLMGGPHSFTYGQRNWGPLREALPGGFTIAPEKRAKLWNDPDPPRVDPPVLPVVLGEDHPICRGLSGPLGVAGKLHRLIARRPQLLRVRKPGPAGKLQPAVARGGATVLARADQQPVVLTGTYGHGRVVMVSAYPSGLDGCMFRTAAWADLLRQALAWLMNRPADLAIARCHLDRSDLALGHKRTLTLDVAPTPEAKGPWRAKALMSRADPGWLSAGREPQFGPPTEHDAEIDAQHVAFTFEPREAGLWRVRLDVSGDRWANTRVADIHVTTPLGLRLETHSGEYVTAPGWPLALRLEAAMPVTAVLRILDADGQEVLRREGVGVGPVDLTLPGVELGDYEVVATAEGQEARLRFCVTQPLERVGLSFVALTSGDTEERSRWWFNYFRSRGFNGFAAGLPASDAPTGPGFNPGAFQRYLVQREGLDLWGEYTHLSLLATHGYRAAEGEKPTRPCLFDPAHADKAHEKILPGFQAAASLPRMNGLEIIDEPHILAANVCYCDHCKAQFRGRYAYDMPKWDEALAARDQRTRDYFEWVVDYAAEVFRVGYDAWKSLRQPTGRQVPELFHVLCSLGSGTLSIANCVAEDQPWTAHADSLHFDCYNYMYPHWRASDKLRWNEYHFMMGHFRFQALRHGQRIGFYIQVTDRDVPVTPYDPVRAPSETLYTALGGGAKVFHLMHKSPFTNTQNCREEKFDALAADIKKVQTVAPLLDRAQTQRSRIAMVFNFHDRLYRYPKHYLPEGYIGLGFYGKDHRPIDTIWPYHKAPVNVAELLVRAFGEVDVIDQRALRDGALDDYRGFVLNGVDYIEDADAYAVAQFVEKGGSLICDHLPTHNLAGGASTILAHLGGGSPDQRHPGINELLQAGVLRPEGGGRPDHFYRDITTSLVLTGKGRTLLFSHDLNELYTSAWEQGNEVLRNRIEELVRRFFFAIMRPHVLSDNPAIEANVLATPDTLVLVVVNHADDRQVSRLTLFGQRAEVDHAVDLVTMKRVALTHTMEGRRLQVDLGEREGRIIALYAALPTRLAITPAPAPGAGTPDTTSQTQNPKSHVPLTRWRRGQRAAFNVELTDDAGQPVCGDQIVEVTVTDSGGEVRRQFGGLRCATNGLLHIGGTLAVNARVGTWTIAAFDRFTTREVRADVVVE